mgnify:CR=1 FL=1
MKIDDNLQHPIEEFSKLIDKKPALILVYLLSLQLIFRLIIFFTTNTFAFTDWRVYLAGIEQIRNGENLPLFSRAFAFLLSYIGYFFKYTLGNLDYFFILNSILGVLVSFVSFFIVKEITNNYRKALLVVALQTIYVEFLAFSSIFYTVIIMLLLVNLVIYLTIKFLKNDEKSKNVIISIFILAIVFATFFFKMELQYFGYLFFLYSLFLVKNKSLFLKIIFLAILTTLTTYLTGELKKSLNPSKTGTIDFIFFGHTFYGGKGGEGDFIFKEKRDLYDKKMKEYFDKNKINNPTSADTGRFQKNVILNFITTEPHMWFLLQARKFFFTFGIVPEGNSFTILYKGLFNRNFILSASIVVFPIVLIILLFIIAFKKESLKAIFNDKILLFLFLFLIYYLGATVFYGHYQERYRIPVVTMFILPFIAIFSDNLSIKNIFKDKKSLLIKIIIVLLFVSAWSYQAYEALILSKDRYGIIFDKDF